MFLLFLLDDRRMMDPDPYPVDPVDPDLDSDPDPEHCCQERLPFMVCKTSCG